MKTKTRRARHASTSGAMHLEVRLDPPSLEQPVPKLIVFDLDDTIWFPELYMMAGAPWSCDRRGVVTDCANEELRVYPAAREAIAMIATHAAFAETKLAVASRTNRAQWAFAVMDLHVCKSRYVSSDERKDSIAHNNKTLRQSVGDLAEIYTGSKRNHFESLRLRTKIPFSDMLFFDNEKVNVTEVGQLGVVSIHCPGGMSQGAWEEGLGTFAENAKRRRAKQAKD